MRDFLFLFRGIKLPLAFSFASHVSRGSMIRLSINLPTKHRLHLKLVQRRGPLFEEPLLPDMGKVLRVRAGSKVSRFFRHVFEHKRIKKILGTNIALIIALSSFIPARAASDIEPEQTVISEETAPLITQSGSQYPVENVRISQGYKFYHPGIDLDGVTGESVYPVMAGVVENISYSRFAFDSKGILSSAYGNAVIVNHGNKITSLYAHLSKIEVEEDQEVTIKTKLGEIGATGRAWGDHLHLEIRDHNYPINPYSILPR